MVCFFASDRGHSDAHGKREAQTKVEWAARPQITAWQPPPARQGLGNWYGVVCDARAEKEEVRLINEKLKQKAAKAKENEEEEKRRLAYYPELAPKVRPEREAAAACKPQGGALGAETQQRRASQLPIAYNQEVELIQRLVEGSAEEKGQKAGR